MKRYMRRFIWFVLLVGMALNFQNCGNLNFEASDIASIHSNDVFGLSQPSSKARMGDRTYIASVFAEVFLPQGGAIAESKALELAGSKMKRLSNYITSNYTKADKILSDKIVSKVLAKADDFQGVCTFSEKDPNCAGRGDITSRMNQAGGKTIPPSSASREGYRISLCNDLVNDTKGRALSNVIFNATGKREARFSETNILDAYDLFYPAQRINKESYNALVDLSNSISAAGDEDLEIWKGVVLSLCYSAGWQIP